MKPHQPHFDKFGEIANNYRTKRKEGILLAMPAVINCRIWHASFSTCPACELFRHAILALLRPLAEYIQTSGYG